MGRAGAARTTLYFPLFGALFCRVPASAFLLYPSPPITTSAVSGWRSISNLLAPMREFIDRKINQLPPPLMAMRSCLSGGLREQRLPVWDSPSRYCHLAAAEVMKLQSQLTEPIITSIVCLFLWLHDANTEHFKQAVENVDWIKNKYDVLYCNGDTSRLL